MVNMKQLFIILLFSFFSQLGFTQDSLLQTELDTIFGKVIDQETKEPLMFATVAIFKSGSETPFTGVETDLDGNYQIVVPTGIYDIQASYAGYNPIAINKIVSNLKREQNFSLKSEAIYPSTNLVIIESITYKIKVQQPEYLPVIRTTKITPEDIKLPTNIPLSGMIPTLVNCGCPNRKPLIQLDKLTTSQQITKKEFEKSPIKW